MKKGKICAGLLLVFCLAAVILTNTVQAETLEDLSRRVKILEQAVIDLQEQCCTNSTGKNVSKKVKHQDIWTCQVAGRKKTFYGNGMSQGLAERDAMEQCQQVSSICRLKECTKE